MYHHIGKTAAFCHLIGIDHIVAHHPAAFAHSGCCTTSDHSTVFVTRQIFFQELSQEAYLLPKFKIGGENRAYRSNIHPIDLCRIYLTPTRSDRRMQTHSSKHPGKFALIGFLFTPIKKTLAIQLNIVYISNADNSFRFIYAVNGVFKGYRLHESVSTSFFYFCTGKKRYYGITGTINCNRGFKTERPLVTCTLNAFYHLSVTNNIRHTTLQKDIDVLFPGDKFCQCKFCLFEIVSISMLANPVIVFDAKNSTNLIAHRVLAYTTENRADIPGGQVTSDDSISFDKSNTCSLPGGGYSRTYPGRTCTCYYYIIIFIICLYMDQKYS